MPRPGSERFAACSIASVTRCDKLLGTKVSRISFSGLDGNVEKSHALVDAGTPPVNDSTAFRTRRTRRIHHCAGYSLRDDGYYQIEFTLDVGHELYTLLHLAVVSDTEESPRTASSSPLPW